jgi:hypothetical protein
VLKSKDVGEDVCSAGNDDEKREEEGVVVGDKRLGTAQSNTFFVRCHPRKNKSKVEFAYHETEARSSRFTRAGRKRV